MTIEEAIVQAREAAAGCPAADKQCADALNTLAEWLEELRAYKETGLTPDEIHKNKSIDRWNNEVEKQWLKYLDMERAGRLVVLPCKVTDTVYTTEVICEMGKVVGERVVSAQIDHVTIGGTTGQPVFDLCTETGGWFYALELGQFYLTKEEAEAALERQNKSHPAVLDMKSAP